MTERLIEQKTVKVVMDCHHSGCAGQMEATGEALTSNPPKNWHKCTMCGAPATFAGVTYPYLRHVDA